jgi:hypothetical protein
MKQIRNLLLDCRAALRRADPAFADSALGEKLDDTILELGKAAQPAPEIAEPETRTAQQVALAWQTAARDLRFSHPELHAQLSARVLQLLDLDSLLDPATEIAALQAQLQQQVARNEQDAAELLSLRQALADAVPRLDGNVPAPEAARLRLRQLVEAASRGGGLPKPAAAEAVTGGMLGREQLREVAEGRRPLSRDERDWCVGEAMVLSGFSQAPAQLLAGGDAALARLILDTPAPPA